MNFLERMAKLIGIGDEETSNPELDTLRLLLEQGRVFKRAEHYNDALDTLEQAERLATAQNNLTLATIISLNRAEVYISQKRWDDARTTLEQLQDKLGESTRQIGYILDKFGVLAQAQGKWEDAQDYYEQARRVARDNNTPTAEGRAQGHLADVYMHDGNASYSVHLLQEALEKLRLSGDLELGSYFTGRLGEAFIATGQEEQGRQLLGRALRIAKQINHRTLERRWHQVLAEQAMLMRRYVSAKEHYVEALSSFDEENAREAYVTLLCRLSKSCLRLREYDHALGYARRAVEFSESLEPDDISTLKAQAALGIVLRSLHQHDTAIDYLKRAEAQYTPIETTHADYSHVEILRNLAASSATEGAIPEAKTYYTKALQRSEKDDDPTERAGTYRDLGILFAGQNDYKSAIENWSTALQLYESIDDYALVARLYNDIANVRRQEGEYAWAMKDFEKALTTINLADDPETRGIVLANAAVAYIDEGDIDTAEAFMVEAIQLAQQIDDRRAEATRRGNYGWLLLSTGRAKRAIETLGYARQQSEILGLPLAVAVQTDNVGLAHQELGEYEKALTYHEQAIEELGGENTPYWEAVILANKGHALISLKRVLTAKACFADIHTIIEDHTYHDVRARLLAGEARIHLLENDFDTARQNADKAVEYAHKTRKRRLLADGYALLAEAQARSGQRDVAKKTWQSAYELYAILRLPQANTIPDWLHTDSIVKATDNTIIDNQQETTEDET